MLLSIARRSGAASFATASMIHRHCDFYFGSVVRRGDLQIAISTAGESPAVAQRIAARDRRAFAEGHRALADRTRSASARDPGHTSSRRGAKGSAASTGEAAILRIELKSYTPLSDRCTPDPSRMRSARSSLSALVPGDPDLLTVKALRLIQSADVILHDDLVPRPFLTCGVFGAKLSTWASAAAQRASRRKRFMH